MITFLLLVAIVLSVAPLALMLAGTTLFAFALPPGRVAARHECSGSHEARNASVNATLNCAAGFAAGGDA
jgi:hypothetical protein